LPFVEIIYETGNSGVAYYETEEEAKSAIDAHHKRAIDGTPGGPIGAPAERIKRALVYDKHPNDFNTADTLSADEAKAAINDLIDAGAKSNDGVIPVGELAVQVRRLTDPMKYGKENRFDSNFVMQEQGELDLKLGK
jgi:hypothetical protein